MRRFSQLALLVCLTLAISATGLVAAQAASVKEVFERYNLLGAWAWDCSKPPDAKSNWVFVNRAIDENHVQRDFMKSATERVWYSVITEATALGPNEVRGISTRDGQVIDGIWRVEGNRMVQWEATQNGKKIIANGRYVSGNGANIPWLNKCGGQQGAAPANTQVASTAAAAQPSAPGHVATASSGQKTQVATHMRYDRQCKPYRVVIQLLSNPANGTVTTEPKNIVIPPETARDGRQPSQCVGKTVPGVAIFYQSRPGFVGQDAFTYRRATPELPNDRLTGDISYTIAVK